MSFADDLETVRQACEGRIAQVQDVALKIYGRYDLKESLLWLSEEVGELISSVRKAKDVEHTKGELADVFAWVICLCNILGYDATDIIRHAFEKETGRQIRTYGQLKYWNEAK